MLHLYNKLQAFYAENRNSVLLLTNCMEELFLFCPVIAGGN